MCCASQIRLDQHCFFKVSEPHDPCLVEFFDEATERIRKGNGFVIRRDRLHWTPVCCVAERSTSPWSRACLVAAGHQRGAGGRARRRLPFGFKVALKSLNIVESLGVANLHTWAVGPHGTRLQLDPSVSNGSELLTRIGVEELTTL